MFSLHRDPPDTLAYRLRSWPHLPDGLRTAPIYRLLSTMTVKPVTRQWMLEQSHLRMRDIESLLALLGPAVEVVDTARVPVAAPGLLRRASLGY